MHLNQNHRPVSNVKEKERPAMNTQPQSELPAEALIRESWDAPIRVARAPYTAFSQWLDAELQKLILRWQDKAAPCARRRRR